MGEHHRNLVGIDGNRSERCGYWQGTKEKEKCGKRGMGRLDRDRVDSDMQ